MNDYEFELGKMQEIADLGLEDGLDSHTRGQFEDLVDMGAITFPSDDKPALEASENPANEMEDDPLTGELGIIENEDGTQSTERSVSIDIDGGYYNIPLLVKGQIDPEGLANGKPPTDEQIDIAYGRFDARGGFHKIQPYESQEEAEQAAKDRSNSGGSLDKFKKNPEPPESSIMDVIFGAIESGATTARGVLDAGVSVASSAVAESAGGLAGLGSLAVGQTSEEAEATINKVRDFITQTPSTDEGKEMLGSVGEVLEPVGRFMKDAENSVAEQVYQKTGSPALAAIASTGPALLAEVVGLGAGKGILQVAKVAKKSRLEREITKAIGESSPTIERLKLSSRAMFKEIEAKGITISPKSFSRLTSKIARYLKSKGVSNPVVTPHSISVLKSLQDKVGSKMSLEDFNALRAEAKIAADNIGGGPDAKYAADIVDDLDNFIGKAGVDDLVSSTGEFPQGLSEDFGVARKLWGQAKRSERIAEVVDKATRDTVSYENGLVKGFRSILNSPKRKRGFSDEQRAVMQEVVNGNKKINLAKALGSLGFNPSNVKAGFGAAAGGYLGVQTMGPFGVVVIPAIGTVSKGLAGRMIANNAKMADAIVRAGVDQRRITKAYLENTPKKLRNPDHLTELLLDERVDLSRLPKSKFTDAAKQKTRARREAIGAARTKEKDPRLKLTLKGTQ